MLYLFIIVSTLLISIVNCNLQYGYSFTSPNNFQIVDLESNTLVLNQTLPENVNVNLVYQVTYTNGKQFPILSLFISSNNDRIFSTIDYDINTNQLSNQSTEMLLPRKLSFEYQYINTGFSYSNSNFYLTCHIDGENPKDLSVLNWNVKTEKLTILNYLQNDYGLENSPDSAINILTNEYYILFFGKSSMIPYIQSINLNNATDQGKLYTFPIEPLNSTTSIYVTSSGDLIAVSLYNLKLTIYKIDLVNLLSPIVFQTDIGGFDNNFDLFDLSLDNSYLVIQNGVVDQTSTILYSFVNLSTFQIDYTYKVTNYYNTQSVFTFF